MEQFLNYKKEILFVFCIGIFLSVMALYQTYAYDVPLSLDNFNRPSTDSFYTFYLDGISEFYNVKLESGESKIVEFTLKNDNDYNLMYSLYRKEDLIDGTIVSVLDSSVDNSNGVVMAHDIVTISLVFVNKSSSNVSYNIGYKSGYENGGSIVIEDGYDISSIYSFPNVPDMVSNMIPIMYDNDANMFAVADITNNDYKYYWYEYNMKRWANSVIVDSSNVIDISNNSHSGINYNGKVNNGMYLFDGSSFIDASLSNYSFGNSFGIVTRVYVSELSDYIVLSNYNDGNGFYLYLTKDGCVGVTLGNTLYSDSYNLITDEVIKTNTWYTISFMYGNGNGSIFINGEVYASRSLVGDVSVSSSSIRIGSSNNTNSMFSGMMSDVIVFNNSIGTDNVIKYFSDEIDRILVINDFDDMLFYYDFSVGSNIPIGTYIDSNDLDVLGYYVWIPRFKYRVWNIDKSINSMSYDINNGIDILFEDGVSSTGNIVCKNSNSTSLSQVCVGSDNDFYTHNAFNINGKDVSGFWVSKFENSVDSDNITLLSVFNKTNNLVGKDIYFANNLVMGIVNNSSRYGFNDKFDSYLISNSEWGAISYLGYSRYGICDFNCDGIGYNNYVNDLGEYLTGCGNDINSNINSVCNSFDSKLGILGSNTLNVYGVYDMAGGSPEVVMAFNSGSRYLNSNIFLYDIYSIGDSDIGQSAFNRSILGDGIGEIAIDDNKGLFNSNISIINDINSVMIRGSKSIFDSGYSNSDYGYRNILVRE